MSEARMHAVIWSAGLAALSFIFGAVEGLETNRCAYDRAVKYFPAYAAGCELWRKR